MERRPNHEAHSCSRRRLRPCPKGAGLGGGPRRPYEAELLVVHAVTDAPLTEGERHLVETEYQTEFAARRRPDEPDVFADLPGASPGLLVRTVEPTSAIRDTLGECLLDGALATARSAGVKNCRTLLRHGDPARAICSVASETEADAVVLGSRGFGELRSFILGSVSHKVAHAAPCTVVTVR